MTNDDQRDFAADVRSGLSSVPKTLSPRYFYDDLGGILFEAICRLPEYYVTRAEDQILVERSGEIIASFDRPMKLVELGSGAATKTRRIIEAILSRQPALRYVAIDIDATGAQKTAEALTAEYRGLSVSPIAATFEAGIARFAADFPGDETEATLALFLGSTIGNLEADARRQLLRSVRGALRQGDALLLGADRVKSPEVLVPAYDDALGVTAAFNRNLLVRINRELGADFNVGAFRHLARYDEVLQRIEMHLVSEIEQQVTIPAADLRVDFAAGESIHTENSYKFSRDSIEALARECGFVLDRSWTDEQQLFANYLLVAA
jgi:L-histidine N-alpha-methyltransferase